MYPKIIFASSGHSPFSSRLYFKELLSLKAKYDNLSIIAPHEKIYEKRDEIKIIGIQKYKSRYNRWSTLYELYRAVVAQHGDILHCHEPDSLLICILIKFRFPHIKVIYDCHEFHPLSFSEHLPPGVKKYARLLIEKIENYIASKADAIITVNEKLGNRFREVCKKVVILPNYPRLGIFKNLNRKDKILNSKTAQMVYAGALNKKRGLYKMIDLLKGLVDVTDVNLVLIGKLSAASENKVRRILQKNNLESKVILKGFLSHEETIFELTKADIGLCLLENNERYRWSEPVKYFEYAATGLPVIMSDLPAIRALIKKNHNGLIVRHDSNREAIKAVQYLVKNRDQALQMAKQGRKNLLEKYNWEVIENRLFDLYEKLS